MAFGVEGDGHRVFELPRSGPWGPELADEFSLAVELLDPVVVLVDHPEIACRVDGYVDRRVELPDRRSRTTHFADRRPGFRELGEPFVAPVGNPDVARRGTATP